MFFSEPHMSPFSLSHFSSVLLTMGASLRKKACCSGLAFVPGPFTREYSFANSTACAKPGDRFGKKQNVRVSYIHIYMYR